MAVRRTITVSITSEQEELIRACLRSGRFASTSEIVRAALRLLDREENRPSAERPERASDGEAARA